MHIQFVLVLLGKLFSRNFNKLEFFKIVKIVKFDELYKLTNKMWKIKRIFTMKGQGFYLILGVTTKSKS